MSFRSFVSAAVVASTFAAFSASSPSFAALDNASTQKGDAALQAPTSPWLEATSADPKKSDAKKSDAKGDSKSGDSKKGGKPVQVGSYGDWGAFLAQGAKDKTCYALATPKARDPAALKRDPAYIFISNRPGEKVHNEVSIIMGFAIKEGGGASADIGGSSFDLVAKGSNAWIKNPAEETQFIEALKKGSKLIVKAPSAKGNVTSDSYSLSGISQALDKVQKDCP